MSRLHRQSLRVLLITASVVLINGANLALAQPRQAQAAPVPAAVKIPQPTEAEIATAQRSLDVFVRSADPATRDILDRYPGLLEVRPPRVNTAIVPDLAPFFRAKHQANLEVARQGDAELVLMGDSITDFWRNAGGPFAGKPVLDERRFSGRENPAAGCLSEGCGQRSRAPR